MLPLPSSLTLYATLGAAAVSAYAGWQVRDWACESAMLKTLEEQVEQEERIREQLDEQSRAYEQARSQANATGRARQADIRTIYRDVPVASSCDIPPDARSLLIEAIAEANAATTSSKPSKSM